MRKFHKQNEITKVVPKSLSQNPNPKYTQKALTHQKQVTRETWKCLILKSLLSFVSYATHLTNKCVCVCSQLRLLGLGTKKITRVIIGQGQIIINQRQATQQQISTLAWIWSSHINKLLLCLTKAPKGYHKLQTAIKSKQYLNLCKGTSLVIILCWTIQCSNLLDCNGALRYNLTNEVISDIIVFGYVMIHMIFS